MSIKEYIKKIKEIKKYEDDREVWHIKRDEILENFFTDIKLNKIKNKKEMIEISNLIYDKLINTNQELWYA